MRKCKFVLIAVLAALLVCSTANDHPVHATAPSPTEIVEETYIIIETPDLGDVGYIAVESSPPEGFSGILCVELQHHGSRKIETLQVTPWQYYYGGAWLPSGTYTIKDAYVQDSDHFLVSYDLEEVEISQEQDAHLTLTLSLDEAEDAERQQQAAVFEPKAVPTETPQSSGEKAAESTEAAKSAAAPESASASEEQPSSSLFLRVLLSCLAAAVFVGIVFICVYFVRRSHND